LEKHVPHGPSGISISGLSEVDTELIGYCLELSHSFILKLQAIRSSVVHRKQFREAVFEVYPYHFASTQEAKLWKTIKMLGYFYWTLNILFHWFYRYLVLFSTFVFHLSHLLQLNICTSFMVRHFSKKRTLYHSFTVGLRKVFILFLFINIL
jgi:hypothetical protein